MRLYICLICLAALIAASPADADEITPSKVEGKLFSAAIGNDSFKLEVMTSSGSIETASFRPNLDWMTKSQVLEYQKLQKTLPGKTRPTMLDLQSRVRMWYIKGNRGNFFVKYKVLDTPDDLWLIIIASEKSSSSAHSIKHKASREGFAADVIQSSQVKALRPGYFVVIAGAFDNKEKCISSLKRLWGAGWKDAYFKKIK